MSLEKNIVNLWGEEGRAWLKDLPTTIQCLAQCWQLSHINPAKNMNWNYIAFATTHSHQSQVVLKISCDPDLIKNEYFALQHFNGKGAIRVLDYHEEYNALLLEQALPGISLKESGLNTKERITVYAQIVKQLYRMDTGKVSQWDTMHGWCQAIDRLNDQCISKDLIITAKELRFSLLEHTTPLYLCHGDLHLDNILKRGKTWCSIDPKGVLGDIAFEAAAFNLLSQEDQSHSDKPSLVMARVQELAASLDITEARLLAWFFLRTMMSVQWFLEDGGDPSHMIRAAEVIHAVITKREN